MKKLIEGSKLIAELLVYIVGASLLFSLIAAVPGVRF